MLICRPPRTIKLPLAAKRNRHPWCTDKIRLEYVYDLSLRGAFASPVICLRGFTLILTIGTGRTRLAATLTLSKLEAAWRTGCLSDAALEQPLKKTRLLSVPICACIHVRLQRSRAVKGRQTCCSPDTLPMTRWGAEQMHGNHRCAAFKVYV